MRKISSIFVAILLLTSCYHADVQQGNIIDQDVVAKLHPGLSKNEVNSILGTPLLNDMTDKDIWTYVYTNQINGGKIEKKILILKFKKSKLIHIN